MRHSPLNAALGFTREITVRISVVNKSSKGMMKKMHCENQLISRVRELATQKQLTEPSAAVLIGTKADEYKSLALFSENMRLACQGLIFAQDLVQIPSNTAFAYHIYSSAVVFYRQLFKGCSGIKRDQDSVSLLGGAIRNKFGEVAVDKAQKPLKISRDRFYIEEFIKHTEGGFKTHFTMIEQADKSLCHFDKESDKNAFAILVFEGKRPNHLLNHFEYSMFNILELHEMYRHCEHLKNLSDIKLRVVAEELLASEASSSLEEHIDNQFFPPKNFTVEKA